MTNYLSLLSQSIDFREAFVYIGLEITGKMLYPNSRVISRVKRPLRVR